MLVAKRDQRPLFCTTHTQQHLLAIAMRLWHHQMCICHQHLGIVALGNIFYPFMSSFQSTTCQGSLMITKIARSNQDLLHFCSCDAFASHNKHVHIALHAQIAYPCITNKTLHSFNAKHSCPLFSCHFICLRCSVTATLQHSCSRVGRKQKLVTRACCSGSV